jgi:hypothetical protein
MSSRLLSQVVRESESGGEKINDRLMSHNIVPIIAKNQLKLQLSRARSPPKMTSSRAPVDGNGQVSVRKRTPGALLETIQNVVLTIWTGIIAQERK